MARLDLDAARVLAAHDPPLISPALYHCAQAAEKAIKSVIVDGNLVPQKTHDLAALRAVAASVDPALQVSAADAALLSGYAVDPRYPGAAQSYTAAELSDAMEAAERVLRAVGAL